MGVLIFVGLSQTKISKGFLVVKYVVILEIFDVECTYVYSDSTSHTMCKTILVNRANISSENLAIASLITLRDIPN